MKFCPNKLTDDEIFKENSSYQTSGLKTRLIKGGYKEYKCERCGRTEWEGVPIPLETHHINGSNTDNRIENLQLLCPNCHSLTDSYCGKNINKKRDKTVIYSEKECPVCGKHFRGRRTYCSDECRKKVKKKTRPLLDIKDDIIKYAKDNCNFCYIAKQMGVTDNAVRKWCKKIGLPIHTKELKTYINQF